jgi:hypothetical protein
LDLIASALTYVTYWRVALFDILSKEFDTSDTETQKKVNEYVSVIETFLKNYIKKTKEEHNKKPIIKI